MLTSYSLVPNITCPTRIITTSATLIDNIFANSLLGIVYYLLLLLVEIGIISNISISDHQVLFN